MGMSSFQRLQISQLAQLSDQELVDYVAAAHAAGDGEAEREALGYVGYAFEGLIGSLIAMKVPARDRHDVLVEVQISLLKATFDGKVIGQLVNFIKTVTRRRIADYTAAQAKKKSKEIALDPGGEDGGISKDLAIAGDETDVLALLDAVESLLADRNPLHQEVIRLYGPDAIPGWKGLSAEETRTEIETNGSGEPVSVDNIAKIWSRFKSDLATSLLDD